MKRFTFLYIVSLLLMPFFLVSCDGILSGKVFHDHEDNGLTITSMKFSDDYAKITLTVDATKDLHYVRLDDSMKVKAYANDRFCHIISPIDVSQPKITNIDYIAPEEAKKSGLGVLVLVDLSQSAGVIEKEYEYVRTINSIFCRENLFLAFMLPDGKVTNVVPASDYIINNYISIESPLRGKEANKVTPLDTVQMTKVQHAYLYRSVSRMMTGLSTRTATALDNAKFKDLIIFSDGQVYNDADNLPIDPQHFVIQEHLINQSHHIPANVNIFYVNLSANASSSITDNNMMRMLCMLSGGKFYSSFPKTTMCSEMLANLHVNINDYVVELSNPRGKIYYGNNKYIRLRFYTRKGTKLIGECSKEYMVGSIYDPQVVSELSLVRVFFTVILIALFVLVAIYAVLQLIWPYISYRIFRRKYVAKYSGINMTLNGLMVADTCYYCKAPFKVGDSIVAKCKHTMHESCWNENDQHCPEFGKQCPEGSHFYDSENLFNPHNGSFYIKWVAVAVVVGLIQWCMFICFGHDLTYDLLNAIISAFSDDDPSETLDEFVDAASGVMKVSPRTYWLPLFGVYFAPLLTMAMTYMAGYRRFWKERVADIIVRGCVTLVVVYFAFLLEFVIVLVCDMYDGLLILDWIPWTITAFAIIGISTYNTRIKIHQSMMLLASLAIGIGSALVWTLFGTLETEGEIIMLATCYLLIGIAISLVVARKLPESDHYFLHVSGAVKDMDIALYKWLKQSADSVVTIGRSVDCSLQLTWDVQADVAPVHASIKRKFGVLYLTAINGSTFVAGKEMEEGSTIRLYHGTKFQIGATNFVFVET